MSYDQKPNTGALFKNQKDGGNPKWPDYRGSLNVDGQEFWLDAWISKSKKGATYMSLKVKPKQESGQRTTRDERPPPADDMNDDIPF